MRDQNGTGGDNVYVALMVLAIRLFVLTLFRSVTQWKRFWTYAACIVVGASAFVSAAFVEDPAWFSEGDVFWIVVVSMSAVTVLGLPWDYRRWQRSRNEETARFEEQL